MRKTDHKVFNVWILFFAAALKISLVDAGLAFGTESVIRRAVDGSCRDDVIKAVYTRDVWGAIVVEGIRKVPDVSAVVLWLALVAGYVGATAVHVVVDEAGRASQVELSEVSGASDQAHCIAHAAVFLVVWEFPLRSAFFCYTNVVVKAL